MNAWTASSELFKPKKTTPADVTYVDVAIPAGAAREGTIQPDVLAQIRNADALLHVARAFDGGAAERPADPWRDVEELELEFTVADLTVVEKRLEKLRTSGRHGSTAEREQNALEEALLDRIEPHLSEGQAAPLLRPRRRRGAPAAWVPLPDPEAGAGRAEHRRGAAGETATARGGGAGTLRPAVDRRGGAGRQDRGGDRAASRGRRGALHGGPRHRRGVARPRHPADLRAARPVQLLHRRRGRMPRLDPVTRATARWMRRRPFTPTWRVASSAPRWSPTRT